VLEGHDRGLKFRPAVIANVSEKDGRQRVALLAVTHTLQFDQKGVEIPVKELMRLGMVVSPASFIVTTDANVTTWPSAEVMPRVRGRQSSMAFGELARGVVDRAEQDVRTYMDAGNKIGVDLDRLRSELKVDVERYRRLRKVRDRDWEA